MSLFELINERQPRRKAALKASIAKFGMLTPVVVDERSSTIDGFQFGQQRKA